MQLRERKLLQNNSELKAQLVTLKGQLGQKERLEHSNSFLSQHLGQQQNLVESYQKQLSLQQAQPQEQSLQAFFLQLLQTYKELYPPSSEQLQQATGTSPSLQELLKNVYIHMRILIERTNQKAAIERTVEQKQVSAQKRWNLRN